MKAQHALGDTAVQQLLMDPGIDREGLVLYIDPQAGAAPPAWLSPMISAEFMKIPRLGMIYGDEPGYVWIRGDALHALRAFINLEGVRVRNCSDLIRNLNIWTTMSKGWATNTPRPGRICEASRCLLNLQGPP